MKARNDPDAWRVASEVRDQLAAKLREGGATPAVSPEVEEVVAGMHVADFPDRRDLAAIRKATPCKVLLVAVYQHRDASRVLRMALIQSATLRNMWHGSVSFSAADVALLASTPDLNRRVLKFAADHQGQQVGNGECWTLAAEALKAAGTKPAVESVFGRKLDKRDAIFPGDILQIEKARFERPGHYDTMPHHTAIIYEVRGPTAFTLIHQNFGAAGKTVSLLPIDTRELKEGAIQAFRPLPAADSPPGGR